MKNKEFVRGIEILSKYVKDDSFDMAVEHDMFYFADESSVTDPKDISELEGLGWFVDSECDSWACCL